MTMIKINVHKAKTHLWRYLKRVQQGEVVVLCNRRQPVAGIRPTAITRRQPRPIGLAKGIFFVPESFVEELPEDMVGLFREGGC
jgi:antitoxin (DNA-binding transcriptional repressor) of toxin-antitoxin stability system